MNAWERGNRNANLFRMGSKEVCVERIITTYIETGKSVRALAVQYGCSKSTIGRYINEYAREEMSHSIYQDARRQAKYNVAFGSGDPDQLGSLD